MLLNVALKLIFLAELLLDFLFLFFMCSYIVALWDFAEIQSALQITCIVIIIIIFFVACTLVGPAWKFIFSYFFPKTEIVRLNL